MSFPRLVANKTVSSMSINKWSHDKNPSGSQVSFISLMRSFTYNINKRHDVGEPCLTPITVVITVVPITLYIMLSIHGDKYT